MDPGDPYLNVVLQWIDQTLSAILNQNYIITVFLDPGPSTADSGNVFYSTNTSIQLALIYDQDYNISVVARNCIGSSAPAVIHIRIVQFDNCTLILKDDVVMMNSCLSTDEMMVSNSTTNSTLDLATQQYGSSIHIIIKSYKCDPFFIH